MSVTKNYVRSENVCKVTFTLPANVAKEAYVVGDFNEWDKKAMPMRKGKQGLSASIELQPGKEYQFRYLLDGNKWLNDETVDGYAETCYPDATNCVLVA